MTTQMTRQDASGKWHIQRPSANKREYHGNGKNAWYGQEEEINGHLVGYASKRYSYRWHKLIVYFDGKRLITAADYRRAEDALNQGV